jgi:hypothetical protein
MKTYLLKGYRCRQLTIAFLTWPVAWPCRRKSVSKKESNLWITFLLPFWHEGNDGNLKLPFFLMALLCTLAHPDKPISIKITFLSSYSSVKIIATIAYKKPKAAPGLDLDARHLPRF